MTAAREAAGAAGAAGAAVLLAASALLATPAAAQECAPDNAGLTLPDGFCALVAADDLGRARHLAVAANGDVFVAVPGRNEGGILALRDTNGDGTLDQRRYVHEDADAWYVRLHGDWLYYATRGPGSHISRVPLRPGTLEAAGPAEVVVGDIPGGRSHGIRTFAIGLSGELFVNIGAPSNSCQREDREERSPGIDPCPLLDTTAGIWLWAANRTGQTRADGRRYATGMRNTVGLTARPGTGQLYGVVHGRDQLSANWGYSDSANAEMPAEMLVAVDDGDDFGWPYCHYDPARERLVLGPEYGGDGRTVGRCAEMEPPLVAFPAHWAPDGIHFYGGTQFPARYRNGAFIAFHGSWNRAPLPQQGFNVVFVPFDGPRPGEWDVFAAGFQERNSRPVDVAEAPDGSLYVSDDRSGRLFRIVYRP